MHFLSILWTFLSDLGLQRNFFRGTGKCSEKVLRKPEKSGILSDTNAFLVLYHFVISFVSFVICLFSVFYISFRILYYKDTNVLLKQ